MQISINNNEETNIARVRFRQLVDHYSKDGRSRIASYIGELSDYKMSNLLYMVESQMEQMGANPASIKKLFFIMIEALQNAIYHGEKDNTGFTSCFVVVGKSGHEYTVHVGNLVKESEKLKVNEYLVKAQMMDLQTIKNKTREMLFRDGISGKGGAGLGLLTIAQKSEKNFDFEFEKFNSDLYLLTLKASVLG